MDSAAIRTLNMIGVGLIHIAVEFACVAVEISYGSDGVFTCAPGAADHKYTGYVDLDGPTITMRALEDACKTLIKRGWTSTNYNIQKGYCCVTFVQSLCAELGIAGIPWHVVFGATTAWTLSLPFTCASHSYDAVARQGDEHATFSLTDACGMEPVPSRKRRSPEPERGAPTRKCARHGTVGRTWAAQSRIPPEAMTDLANALRTRGLWRRHFAMPPHLQHVTHLEVQQKFGVSEWQARKIVEAAFKQQV